MITNDYFYIDKTMFIKEWWENGDAVTLITRPRRFGKTLNLNMAECFFSVSYSAKSSLFNAAFKTNPFLERAIMTGITRVSKESIFSDLNNPVVVTATSDLYADCFGFTQQEVWNALEEYGLSSQKEEVQNWYDGFTFDTGKHPSKKTEPERFCHGFVLGLMVDLAGRYSITSNRESGFGRYDVVLEPLRDTDDAIILEFKIHDPDDEDTLTDTVQEALAQIERKKYSAALESRGIAAKRIRRYGFAFEGKTVLIG